MLSDRDDICARDGGIQMAIAVAGVDKRSLKKAIALVEKGNRLEKNRQRRSLRSSNAPSRSPSF